MAPEEAGYSVKEILDLTRTEQTAGFAEIRTLLSLKADRSDVERLGRDLADHRTRTEESIEHLDERLTTVEANDNLRSARANVLLGEKERRFTKREKMWGIIGAVALLLATVGGPIIAAHS